ncbi:hypothetical protein M8009_18665 [Halomonas sp. ATCH28]|uniref:Lipocalin-like domain-containing protein n=1 Tax=Halomonas gemina TaxID=2945105 RepID=A0ABT0T5W5_9GAMM|nr:hypothetical protein [Halomonas gemina]MCL7942297.1 hypothetical protein [Halomonas gemina]
MNNYMEKIIKTIFFAAVLTMACPLTAGGDIIGFWQPYSRTAQWLGSMTVAPDQLSFEAGPTAQLEPVRTGGSIFRITNAQDDSYLECGGKPVNYVGFHVLDNGLLAFLHYRADAPPAEPTGRNSMEVIRNGACAVIFYAR